MLACEKPSIKGIKKNIKVWFFVICWWKMRQNEKNKIIILLKNFSDFKKDLFLIIPDKVK